MFSLFGLLAANAQIEFDETKEYYIKSIYNNGWIGLGAQHNATPQIYCVTTGAVDYDGWWIIKKTSDGTSYTIQNSQSGEYLVFDAVTYNSTNKYLMLSTDGTSDEAKWTFDYYSSQNALRVVSVADDDYVFNLRTNGTTNLLGCYRNLNSASNNELFQFIDKDGNQVPSKEVKPVDPDPITGDFAEYVDSLQLNNKNLVYNHSSWSFMMSLPESLRGGKDFTATVKFKPLAKGTIRILIDGQPAGNGEEITIPAVTCSSPYDIEVEVDGEVVASSTLSFTFLPIVQINVSSCNGSYYTNGTFHLLDPDRQFDDSLYTAKFKYRGATAQGYEKKAYNVKMIDADDNKVDRTFLGMREDNNWVLDAMAIDKADMRNRVATDLWNDFSHEPYHQAFEKKKIYTGTHGRFVELFLNGSYRGIYCFTEKVDRKQLRLESLDTDLFTDEETVRGTLYKTTGWSYEVFMGHESNSSNYPRKTPKSYNNYSTSWSYYEGKYPDVEDGETFDYGPIWRAVNLVAAGTDEEFVDSFAYYFDKPVIDDYYLFLELILATDNHGKNMFYYCYDTNPSAKKLAKGFTEKDKVGIAVWDLDGTWGRRWDGGNSYTSNPQTDFETFISRYEHGQLTYFTRLRNISYFNWEETLASRYCQVRRTWFNPDSLCKRFTDYYSLFEESGADTREENQWRSYHSSVNIGSDVNWTCNWIRNRIAYLDNKYGYSESTGSITISASGYNTHFSTEAYLVPEGVEAGVVTAVRNDSMDIDFCYPAGSVIPARVPVLVKGQPGTYTTKIYGATLHEETPEKNLLKAYVQSAITTGGAGYFRFSHSDDSTLVGFYAQRSDQGAWQARAGEVYLVTPTKNSADSVLINHPQKPVIEEVSITISEGGYTTYFSSNSYTLPAGTEAGIVTAASNTSMTVDYRYKAGDIIPANTPVIIKGAAGDYTIAIIAPEGTSPSPNLLAGSDEPTAVTGDYTYRFDKENSGETIGFYRTDTFTTGAHEAYLSLSAFSEANAYLLNGGVISGINEINEINKTGIVYDLQGRIVKKPVRGGIYLINGKKVILK